MIPLPPIDRLICRCKALAALDLILSPDWQTRFYSFDSRWSQDEQMASMRDGCGDEWWIVFHRSGWAALKGLGHDSSAWSLHHEKLSSALQRSFPGGFGGFSTEPAFRWSETSFTYFHTVGATGWTRGNDLAGYSADDAGDTQLLAHVVGSPSDYAAFARDYYETEVDEHIVTEIFTLHPITDAVVGALNPSILLGDISEELYGQIQYPRTIVD
jgi:hypothetical protein